MRLQHVTYVVLLILCAFYLPLWLLGIGHLGIGSTKGDTELRVCIIGNVESTSYALAISQMWDSKFAGVFYLWGKDNANRQLPENVHILDTPPKLPFTKGLELCLNFWMNRAPDQCDYFFTHDDDLKFYITEPFRGRFAHLSEALLYVLVKYRPSVLSFPFHSGHGDRPQMGDKERQELELELEPEVYYGSSAEVWPMTGSDNGMILYHKSVIDVFFPFPPTGEGGIFGQWTLGTHYITLFAPFLFEHKALTTNILRYNNTIGLVQLFRMSSAEKKRAISIEPDSQDVHVSISRHPYEWTRKQQYRNFLSSGLRSYERRFGQDLHFYDLPWRDADCTAQDGTKWDNLALMKKLVTFYDIEHEALSRSTLIKRSSTSVISQIRAGAPFHISLLLFAMNRTNSFMRLWKSIESAVPISTAVSVHIHCDSDPGQAGLEMRKFIESLVHSRHGQLSKHISVYQRGLRSSIMEAWLPSSMDEFAIFLEDDIEVSPYFLVFAERMIRQYYYIENRHAHKLMGVSLYQPLFDELTDSWIYNNTSGSSHLPYLWQSPTSWGAVQSPYWWREFRNWYSAVSSQDMVVAPSLPSNRWPPTKSWKKYLVRFTADRGLYFLYTRLPNNRSLTTNHVEIGTNCDAKAKEKNYQKFKTPLLTKDDLISTNTNALFATPKIDSLAVKDLYGHFHSDATALRNQRAGAYDGYILILRVSAPDSCAHLEEEVQKRVSWFKEQQTTKLVGYHLINACGANNNTALSWFSIPPSDTNSSCDCFFLMDESSELASENFNFAFRTWRGVFADFLVGFTPSYEVHRKSKTHHQYHILPGTSRFYSLVRAEGGVFLHRKYYEELWKLQQRESLRWIRSSSCSDIVLNLIVAKSIGKGPVAVESSGYVTPRTYSTSSSCLTRAVKELFADVSPLRYSTVVFSHSQYYGIGAPPAQKHYRFAATADDMPILATADDFTLGTHVDGEKLQALPAIVQAWPGKIILSVYSNDKKMPSELSQQPRVQFLPKSRSPDVAYPVNSLRQMALANATTRFFFPIDIDFIPSSGLYGLLTRNLRWLSERSFEYVFVIAAFEVDAEVDGENLPRNKADLQTCMLHSQCRAIRVGVWTPGHFETNYYKWWGAERPYEIESADNAYEPYIVGERKCLPDYSTFYDGWGYDKASWVYQLKRWGAKFLVLPNEFILHRNHSPSKWSNSKPLTRVMAEKFETYKAQVEQTAPPAGCYRNSQKQKPDYHHSWLS